MRFFSEAMNYPSVKIFMALLAIGMIARGCRTRHAFIQAILAFLVANGLTDLFKALHPEHRPFQELHDVVMWVGTSPSHGTASAHSANMAALAVVFTYRLRWWGTPWIIVAIVTGFSRVFCGAHYPHQVLLGWACGLLAGTIITKVWDAVQAYREKQSGLLADANQPTKG